MTEYLSEKERQKNPIGIFKMAKKTQHLKQTQIQRKVHKTQHPKRKI